MQSLEWGMDPNTSRSQLNVRLSPALAKKIDEKRIELSKTETTIPSRSEVLRKALGAYLEIDIDDFEVDGRKAPRK